MDEPIDYHPKWNKSDRGQNAIQYHLYMESEKQCKWTYIQCSNRHRKQTCGCQGGGAGSLELAMQTIICRMDEQQGPTV